MKTPLTHLTSCLHQQASVPKGGFAFGVMLFMVLQCQALFAQTFSGIGNTWIGGIYTSRRGEERVKFIQGKISEGYVTAEGELYAAAVYEEAHVSLARYWDNGDGRANVEIVGPDYWATRHITVALSDEYVYTNVQTRIESYKISDHSDHRKLELGTRILGLAWGNGELYVSDNGNNKIQVYDQDFNLLREFAFDKPRKLTVAPDGNLWVIRGGEGQTLTLPGTGASVIKVDKTTGAELDVISDVIIPTAIATSHANGNLLIADADADRNNIRIYNPANGNFTDTFGKSVSNAAVPGDFTDATQFDYLTAIGQAANGDYVVAWKGSIYFTETFSDGQEGVDQSGVVVRRITQAGQKVWEGVSNTFIDNADLDPADHTIAYTATKRIKIDYSQSPGNESTVLGYTLDRKNYPDDPRITNDLITFSRAFRRDGKLFTVVTNQWNAFYCIYRQGAGEIMVPSIILRRDSIWIDGHNGQPFDGRKQPAESQYMNHPAPFDGYVHFDEEGTMWIGYDIFAPTRTFQQFRRYPCTGLTANGIPSYSVTNFTEYTCPDFDKVQFVQYDKGNDILYVSGFYTDDPNREWSWRGPGRHIKRYDNFLGGNHSTFEERSTMDFPQLLTPDQAIVSWSQSTPYVFIGQRKEDEFRRNTIYTYDSNTGSLFQKWNMPITVGGGTKGNNWPGTGYDTPHGVRSVKKADGSYVIMAEDVSFAKVFFITWTPPKLDEDQVVLTNIDNNIVSGEAVNISAYVNDTDGSVKKMDFYVNNVKDTTDTSLPFGYTWLPTQADTVSIVGVPLDAEDKPVGIPDTLTLISKDLPDLVVTNVTTYPANAAVGDTVGFVITVKNQGPGPKVAGDVIGFPLFISNDNGLVVADTTSRRINPGDSVQIYTNSNGFNNTGRFIPRQGGVYEVTVVLDDINRIIETDENNNNFTGSICIGTPDGAPSISITAPQDSATIGAGIPVLITVNASDCDGSVQKVEFYEGNTKIGESSESPFSFEWTDVTEGRYAITAKAIDNENKTAVSDTVTFQAAFLTRYEAEDAVLTNAQIINKPDASGGAAASGIDFDDSRVSFKVFAQQAGLYYLNVSYANGMGEVSSHRVTLNNEDTLLVEYPSRGWDDFTIISKPVVLKQGVNTIDFTRGNLYADLDLIELVYAGGIPIVDITTPAGNAVLLADTAVTITAEATDFDGSIAKVTFYEGGNQLGEDASAPYAFTWNNAAAGSYQLVAVATDNEGKINADTVSVEVQAPRTSENPAPVVNGLKYAYFEGVWDVVPDFSALDTLEKGVVPVFDISVRNRDDDFAVAFDGYVNVPATGVYTFYLNSDDGSVLWIGDKKVVDFDGIHGADGDVPGSIALQAGKHALRVGYMERGGGQVLDVKYAGPSIEKQFIPDTVLYRLKTDSIAPSAVINLMLRDTTLTGVTLVWNAATDNEGVSGYKIYVGEAVADTTADATYTFQDLAPATEYTFAVTAVDAEGNESAKTTISFKTPDTVPPTAPANLSASANESSVVLRWEAATDNVGVTGYKVYQDGVVVDTVTATTATISGLVPQTFYTFSVSAIDRAGNESERASIEITTDAFGGIEDRLPGGGVVRIYPNPFEQDFRVEVSGREHKQEDIRVAVFSLRGTLVAYEKLKPEDGKLVARINLSGKPKGTYVVTLASRRFVYFNKVQKL